MPDVYTCSKICENTMVDRDYHGAAASIADIPDNHRLLMFRGHDATFIEHALRIYHDYLIDAMAQRCDCPREEITLMSAADDNRVGADVIGDHGGRLVDIELKFGSETNSNIGMATASGIAGDVTGILAGRFSASSRRERLNDLLTGATTLRDIQAGNIECFLTVADECTPRPLDHDERSNLERLLSRSGSSSAPSAVGREYMKVTLLSPTRIFRSEAHYHEESWMRSIEVTANRLNVLLDGEHNHVRMTFNNKNNLHYPGGKVPARYYVGSPSFNVFVKQA